MSFCTTGHKEMTCGATLELSLNAKEKAKIRERNQGSPFAILGINHTVTNDCWRGTHLPHLCNAILYPGAISETVLCQFDHAEAFSMCQETMPARWKNRRRSRQMVSSLTLRTRSYLRRRRRPAPRSSPPSRQAAMASTRQSSGSMALRRLGA